MSRRRRVGVIALMLLLFVAGAWWRAGAPGEGARRAIAASAPVGDAMPAPAAARSSLAASAIESGAARAVASAQDRDRAALKQRMKADWCGFGAEEWNRQTDALLEPVRAAGGNINQAVLDAVNRTPGAEVVDEAAALTRLRWVKVLTQRGDPRSRAVAELLGGSDGDRAKARARLQALARTTSDPMVTALALRYRCDEGACSNVEASQWSRLEPANLQSWLVQLRDPKVGSATRQDQTDYALERMASEARYSNTYWRELHELLLELPQVDPRGPAAAAEFQLITRSVGAGWTWPGWGPFAPACASASSAEGTTLQRCARVADLIWQGDTMVERSMALSLVRRMLAAQPALRARWEARAREHEAVNQWAAQRPPVPDTGGPCEAQVEMRGQLQRMALQGEWGLMRAEMQAAGADDAVLSARWRHEAGRGALDPERPASAAR